MNSDHAALLLEVGTSDAQRVSYPRRNIIVGAVGEYEVVTVAGSLALKMAKRHLPAR